MSRSFLWNRFPAICATALAVWLVGPAAGLAQRKREFTAPTPLASGSTLIVGFLGSGERVPDADMPAIQLAQRLRALELTGVYVETAEYSRRSAVLKLIEAASGRDEKGRCTSVGCREVRILLYGRGAGAEALLKVAQELKQRNLPVALAVEVDSAATQDELIPANVARAANLYGTHRLSLRGRRMIRAEDTAKTIILGNLRFTEAGRWVDMSSLAEEPDLSPPKPADDAASDPQVWNRVEDYILDELHRAGIPGAPAPPH